MRNSGEGTGGSPQSGSLLFIVYSFALLDVLLSNVSIFFKIYLVLNVRWQTGQKFLSLGQGKRWNLGVGVGRAQRNH